MSPNSPGFLYKSSAEAVIWREWDGLYAVFSPRDESTHFVNPISSIVFEQLKNTDQPLSFDNLVSCVVRECGGDADSDQIIQLLDERLSQMQRIGLIEVLPEK